MVEFESKRPETTCLICVATLRVGLEIDIILFIRAMDVVAEMA
jgi:hypothetical protein